MILTLTGVLRDASQPSATIAQLVPTRTDLTWPRAEDGTISLSVLTQARLPADLTGAAVVFAIRRAATDTEAIVSRQAVIISAPGGTATIALVSADTIDLKEDVKYRYDVQLTDADGKRWQLVPESHFEIAPIIAQPDEMVTIPVTVSPQPLGASTFDRVLFDPSAAELQDAIDASVGVATAARPWKIAVFGSVVLEDVVTLRSHLRLRLRDAYVTTTMTPLVGAIDDPTNCLFWAPIAVNGVVGVTHLAANTADGGRRFTVEDASWVTAAAALVAAGRTFVRIDGVQNMTPLIECGAETQEIHLIKAASGVAVDVAQALKYTRNKDGNLLTFGRPRVEIVTPVEDVEIEGGTLDCEGLNVAVGILLEGSRNVRISGVQGKGFGRAVVNARDGAEQIVIDRYRALGGSNCNVLFEGCHSVQVIDPDFDGDGDWLHPAGLVRAWYAHQRGCTAVTVRGGRIGKHPMGIRCFGGREVNIDTSVEEIDETQRIGRTTGDDGFDFRGAAFGSGAGNVGAPWYLDEFGVGLTLNLRLKNIKTTVDGPSVYIHDFYRVAVPSLGIANFRDQYNSDNDGDGDPDYYNGITLSDNELSSHFGPVTMQGMTGWGICYENGGGGDCHDVDLFAFGTRAGNSNGPAPMFRYIGPSLGLQRNIYRRVRMGDGALVEIAAGASVPWHNEYRDLVFGNVGLGYGGPMEVVELAKLVRLVSGTQPAEAGALVEAVTGGGDEMHVTSNLTNGLKGKWVWITVVVGGGPGGVVAAAAPLANAYGIVMVRSDQTVSRGDKLVQDGTTALFIVDNAETDPNEYIVADESYTAGAGSRQVQYRRP